VWNTGKYCIFVGENLKLKEKNTYNWKDFNIIPWQRRISKFRKKNIKVPEE
jgi:hypothetical protein